jgi:hypothetical protein
MPSSSRLWFLSAWLAGEMPAKTPFTYREAKKSTNVRDEIEKSVDSKFRIRVWLGGLHHRDDRAAKVKPSSISLMDCGVSARTCPRQSVCGLDREYFHAKPHRPRFAGRNQTSNFLISFPDNILANDTVMEIAEELSSSAKRINTYRARVLEKFGVKSSAEIVQYAIRNGLVI